MSNILNKISKEVFEPLQPTNIEMQKVFRYMRVASAIASIAFFVLCVHYWSPCAGIALLSHFTYTTLQNDAKAYADSIEKHQKEKKEWRVSYEKQKEAMLSITKTMEKTLTIQPQIDLLQTSAETLEDDTKHMKTMAEQEERLNQRLEVAVTNFERVIAVLGQMQQHRTTLNSNVVQLTQNITNWSCTDATHIVH